MDQGDRTITITMLTEPHHINLYGNVHGGEIMRLMDNAAGCTALRYSGENCVAAHVAGLHFIKPIHIGVFLTCTGTVVYTGRTSIEILVTIDAEGLIDGKNRHRAAEAYFTYVAVDEQGNPKAVPPFTPETTREKKLWEHVRRRREFDMNRKERP